MLPEPTKFTQMLNRYREIGYTNDSPRIETLNFSEGDIVYEDTILNTKISSILSMIEPEEIPLLYKE